MKPIEFFIIVVLVAVMWVEFFKLLTFWKDLGYQNKLKKLLDNSSDKNITEQVKELNKETNNTVTFKTLCKVFVKVAIGFLLTVLLIWLV